MDCIVQEFKNILKTTLKVEEKEQVYTDLEVRSQSGKTLSCAEKNPTSCRISLCSLPPILTGSSSFAPGFVPTEADSQAES